MSSFCGNFPVSILGGVKREVAVTGGKAITRWARLFSIDEVYPVGCKLLSRVWYLVVWIHVDKATLLIATSRFAFCQISTSAVAAPELALAPTFLRSAQAVVCQPPSTAISVSLFRCVSIVMVGHCIAFSYLCLGDFVFGGAVVLGAFACSETKYLCRTLKSLRASW